MEKKLFGSIVRQTRRAMGLTQEDFGKKFGVKQQSVYGWETGRSKASKEIIDGVMRLAVEHGTDQEELEIIHRDDALSVPWDEVIKMVGRIWEDDEVFRNALWATIRSYHATLVEGDDMRKMREQMAIFEHNLNRVTRTLEIVLQEKQSPPKPPAHMQEAPEAARK